jgi:hypothetical protein
MVLGGNAGLQWPHHANRRENLKARHFPHTVYLVLHLPTNSYGSAYAEEMRGLACFTRPAAARRFAGRMETRHNLIVEETMADACEIASQARLPVLILADEMDAPLLHHLSVRKSRS